MLQIKRAAVREIDKQRQLEHSLNNVFENLLNHHLLFKQGMT